MASIDDRIVSIQFDNDQFEKRMQETIASLDKLRESLDFANSNNSFDQINKSASDFDLSNMGDAVDNISNKFSALGAVGFTAIQDITQNILGFVAHIADIGKTDILAPILTGGKQRSMNIEQAKFMFQGLGIDVNEGMNSALQAVLGTAFGLDEAAKAAAQFGASGIKVGADMTSALRGVAGAAALTGRGFTEIADIFAGSAGSGKVTNVDLLQFATRGLNAAAAVGKVMGKTEAEIHEMAANGELDFATFASAMDKAFGAHATEANKTYAGSLANLHAAMSRLGASIVGPKLEQERVIFNALSPVIDNVSGALQPLIKMFNNINQVGADRLVKLLTHLNLSNLKLSIPNFAQALLNVFAGVTNVINIIKQAFRDIFPSDTTSNIIKLSEVLNKLTSYLAFNQETITKLVHVFNGFFAIIEIGWTIIKELANVLFDLFKTIAPASSGLLDFSANAGDMAVRLNEALVAGGGIHRFFERIGDVIATAINFVKNFTFSIKDFFGVVSDSKPVEDSLNRVSQRFDNLVGIPDRVGAAFDRFRDRFKPVFDALDELGNYIKTWFGSLGDKIAQAFQPGDFNNALDLVNVGLLGGITLMLRNFVRNGFKEDFGLGFVKKLIEPLDALTGKLKAMTTNVKADTLVKIAAAMALLTASMVALALIDSKALTKALTAIAVGFGELVGVMTVMDKSISSFGGAARMAVVSGAMIAIAGAIGVLTISIELLSRIDAGALAKGLTGVGVGLGILVAATQLLSTDSAGLITAGIAMSAISTGLLILSEAVKSFSDMKWGEMGKGLVGVAGGITILALAMNLMPPSSVISGLGFIEISSGLLILAKAVSLFGDIPAGEMAKGLIGIGAALVIVAAAMNLMPLTLPITAGGLILVSIALSGMALAVKAMGENDLGTLAKGIGAFAAMLLVLAIGVNAMNGALPGAVALVIVAAALGTLTKVLENLAKLSIAQIATGLAAIAAVLLVLAGVALLLEPVLPAMLGLGVAVGALGLGFALFGAGALLVVKALRLLSTVGKAGAQAILDIVIVFLTAKIQIAKAFADLIISFAENLLKAAPLLVRLIQAVLQQLLETIIQLAPGIALAISAIVTDALSLIRELAPELIQTGFELLLDFLQGIRNNISQIVNTGVEILTSLAAALIDNMSILVGAGTAVIVAFIFELGNHVGEIVNAGVELLVNLLLGISNSIDTIVTTVAKVIAKFIEAVVGSYGIIIDAGAKALVKFLEGIGKDVVAIAKAGKDIVLKLLEAAAKDSVDFTNKAGDVLVNFLNGMADAIRTHNKELREAGKNIAGAIIDGITFGLSSHAGDVIDAIKNIGGGMVGGLLKTLHINSPSKDFIKIGHSVLEGLEVGIGHDTSLMNAVDTLGEQAISRFQESLSQIPIALSGVGNFNPVITPVLDLSKVKAASSTIDSMMKVEKITADISIGQASLIARTATDTQTTPDPNSQNGSQEINFNQNIYSPTALSTNDIYRNTKSQIALAKEDLNIS